MKFKKTVMSTALEELLGFPGSSDAEVVDFDESEGDKLIESLEITTEAIETLNTLGTAMESAKTDVNLGQYNVALYQNILSRVCKNLHIDNTKLSQESFGDGATLSTEAIGETIARLWKAFKELLAKFFTWVKGLFWSRDSRRSKIAAEARELQQKSKAVGQLPKVKEYVSFQVKLSGIALDFFKPGEEYDIEAYGRYVDDQIQRIRIYSEVFEKMTEKLAHTKSMDEACELDQSTKKQKVVKETVEITIKEERNIDISPFTVNKLLQDHKYLDFEAKLKKSLGYLESFASEKGVLEDVKNGGSPEEWYFRRSAARTLLQHLTHLIQALHGVDQGVIRVSSAYLNANSKAIAQ